MSFESIFIYRDLPIINGLVRIPNQDETNVGPIEALDRIAGSNIIRSTCASGPSYGKHGQQESLRVPGINPDSWYTADPAILMVAPYVSTDSVETPSPNSATATGTIINRGSSDVIEYGFVYSPTNVLPTLEDSTEIIGSGPFVGEFEGVISINTPPFNHDYYFRAYATNSAGTGYGQTIIGNVFICLIKGTKISLADGGIKPIEEVSYDDNLLVWDFDEGKFGEAKPVWIMQKFSMPTYKLAKFSDGSTLGTINNITGHSIYNDDTRMFAHLSSEETPLNTTTFSQSGSGVQLVDMTIVEEEIEFYNIITHSHINLFANGILTSSTLNNLYPIENMKFVKTDPAARNNAEFDWAGELVDGLRLKEQPATYPHLAEKINRLISTASKSE